MVHAEKTPPPAMPETAPLNPASDCYHNSAAEPIGYARAAPEYWAANWRGVLPLRPRTKKPPPDGFTGHDGIDPSFADVTAWSEERADANLCLRLPDGVVGIDVDAYEAKTGAAALAEAERRWGPLPGGPRSTSREGDLISGIRLFRVPPGKKLEDVIVFRELKIGDIEIVQRHHRYAVVWPSIHPDGRQYWWTNERGQLKGIPTPDELPELPQAWLDALTPRSVAEPSGAALPPVDVASALTVGDASPAVAARLQEAISAANGAVGSRHDNTRDHILALLGMGERGEAGVLAALLVLRETFAAAVSADGSRSRAIALDEFDRMVSNPRVAALLAEPSNVAWMDQIPTNGQIASPLPALDATPVIERSWRAVDLASVLAGKWQAPAPVVGRRGDGVGLFYAAKVHSIASESEAGKSWLALAAAFAEIQAGNHVAYLDFEDDEGGVVGRLLALQLSPDVIRRQFHYVRPVAPLTSSLVDQADLAEILTTHRPTLAVIDGITEAMTMHGLDPLSNSDIAMFGRILPRRLARAGCAAVCLDHVVKDADARGRYALGGVHKLNAIDGAAFTLENVEPFGIGRTGRSAILITKDRPGALRKHGRQRKDRLTAFGELVLTSHDESYCEFEITAETAAPVAEFRPTALMGKICAAIETHGPMPQREILVTVKGKRDYAIAALSLLQRDGYVTRDSPHKLIKPWEEL